VSLILGHNVYICTIYRCCLLFFFIVAIRYVCAIFSTDLHYHNSLPVCLFIFFLSFGWLNKFLFGVSSFYCIFHFMVLYYSMFSYMRLVVYCSTPVLCVRGDIANDMIWYNDMINWDIAYWCCAFVHVTWMLFGWAIDIHSDLENFVSLFCLTRWSFWNCQFVKCSIGQRRDVYSFCITCISHPGTYCYLGVKLIERDYTYYSFVL